MKHYSPSTLGFYDVDVHGNNIPDDAIEISDEHYEALLAGQSAGNTIAVDSVGYIILQAPSPLTLDQLKKRKIAQLERDRNAAIQAPVTSSALGSPYVYAARAENRQFLNDLVTLNAGGKFTCTNVDGAKLRRTHTAAQLTQLAGDYQAAIEAKFDYFEQLVAQVSMSATMEEIDQIVWAF